MYFDSFQDFIVMGGHGFYVWLSYGISLLSLIFYFYFSNRQSKNNIAELKKFYLRIDSHKVKESNSLCSSQSNEQSLNSNVEGN